MLSILIPIYNFDTRSLVKNLYEQAERLGIEFEIRCYDDASSPEFQKLHQDLEINERIIYHKLPKNLGRSGIRNLLAADAAYEYLLFLDCDVMPCSKQFLNRYLACANQLAIIYGGLDYKKEVPSKEHILRWKYGIQREAIGVEARNKKPYLSFKTCNFLIRKDLFNMVKFDESFKVYGHEDTRYGMDLYKKGLALGHIDNAVYHLGLDSSEEFLKKSEMAIMNLHKMLINPEMLDYLKEAKLVRYYTAVKLLYLKPLVKIAWFLSKGIVLSNLKSSNPSLMLFDWFKLNLLLGMDELG